MCPLARSAVAVNRATADPPLAVTGPGARRSRRTPSSAAASRSGPDSPDRGTFTLTFSMAA